jgi:hypothetical protein
VRRQDSLRDNHQRSRLNSHLLSLVACHPVSLAAHRQGSPR